MGWDEAETQGANMSQQLHLRSTYRGRIPEFVSKYKRPFFTVTKDVQVFEQLYLHTVTLEM